MLWLVVETEVVVRVLVDPLVVVLCEVVDCVDVEKVEVVPDDVVVLWLVVESELVVWLLVVVDPLVVESEVVVWELLVVLL